jgi:hypothetical protein
MTAIADLRAFLDAEGLTTDYTIRYHRFDDAGTAGQRVMLFREDSNGGGDVYVQRHMISVYLIGGELADLPKIEQDSAAVARACRTATTGAGSAYKINTLNNPRSPSFLEDDRPMAEVVVEVFREDT